MKYDRKKLLLFIIPSTLGVLLFMVPILVNRTWTIAVKVLADIINGAVALILANFTPIFAWLGKPFEPLLRLLAVPDAEAAASTMIVCPLAQLIF